MAAVSLGEVAPAARRGAPGRGGVSDGHPPRRRATSASKRIRIPDPDAAGLAGNRGIGTWKGTATEGDDLDGEPSFEGDVPGDPTAEGGVDPDRGGRTGRRAAAVAATPEPLSSRAARFLPDAPPRP